MNVGDVNVVSGCKNTLDALFQARRHMTRRLWNHNAHMHSVQKMKRLQNEYYVVGLKKSVGTVRHQCEQDKLQPLIAS